LSINSTYAVFELYCNSNDQLSQILMVETIKDREIGVGCSKDNPIYLDDLMLDLIHFKLKIKN